MRLLILQSPCNFFSFYLLYRLTLQRLSPQELTSIHSSKNYTEKFCLLIEYMNICGALRDSVSFAQFKKREKHPWRSATFSKVAG